MTDGIDGPVDQSTTQRPALRRWLAGGAVATLATVVGLSLALRSGAAPACAAPARPVAALPAVGALLAPPAAGTVYKGKATFASQWWFAVLVAGHGNPLRSVEVRQGSSGQWRAAARESYNYWLIDSGAGPGPYQIRVTDTRGHRVTATGIRLAPGKVQRSSVRMYGGSSRGSVAATATPSARLKPSASASTRASARPTPSVAVTIDATASVGPTAIDAFAAAPLVAPSPACG